MALRVPETNFRDHFSIQTSPQNPQKGTLGTQIGPRKLIFGRFFDIFAPFSLEHGAKFSNPFPPIKNLPQTKKKIFPGF